MSDLEMTENPSTGKTDVEKARVHEAYADDDGVPQCPCFGWPKPKTENGKCNPVFIWTWIRVFSILAMYIFGMKFVVEALMQYAEGGTATSVEVADPGEGKQIFLPGIKICSADGAPPLKSSNGVRYYFMADSTDRLNKIASIAQGKSSAWKKDYKEVQKYAKVQGFAEKVPVVITNTFSSVGLSKSQQEVFNSVQTIQQGSAKEDTCYSCPTGCALQTDLESSLRICDCASLGQPPVPPKIDVSKSECKALQTEATASCQTPCTTDEDCPRDNNNYMCVGGKCNTETCLQFLIGTAPSAADTCAAKTDKNTCCDAGFSSIQGPMMGCCSWTGTACSVNGVPNDGCIQWSMVSDMLSEMRMTSYQLCDGAMSGMMGPDGPGGPDGPDGFPGPDGPGGEPGMDSSEPPPGGDPGMDSSEPPPGDPGMDSSEPPTRRLFEQTGDKDLLQHFRAGFAAAAKRRDERNRRLASTDITYTQTKLCYEINNDELTEAMEIDSLQDKLSIQIELVRSSPAPINSTLTGDAKYEAQCSILYNKTDTQQKSLFATCVKEQALNPSRELLKVYPEYDSPSVEVGLFEQTWLPCDPTKEVDTQCRNAATFNGNDDDPRSIKCTPKPGKPGKHMCARVCTAANFQKTCAMYIPEFEKCELKFDNAEVEACKKKYQDMYGTQFTACKIAPGQSEGYCDPRLTTQVQDEATTKVMLGTNVQNKIAIRKLEYATSNDLAFVPEFVEYDYRITILPFAREAGNQVIVTSPSNSRARDVVNLEITFMKRSYVKERTIEAYTATQALGDATAIIGFFTGFCLWGGPGIVTMSYSTLDFFTRGKRKGPAVECLRPLKEACDEDMGMFSG